MNTEERIHEFLNPRSRREQTTENIYIPPTKKWYNFQMKKPRRLNGEEFELMGIVKTIYPEGGKRAWYGLKG